MFVIEIPSCLRDGQSMTGLDVLAAIVDPTRLGHIRHAELVGAGLRAADLERNRTLAAG